MGKILRCVAALAAVGAVSSCHRGAPEPAVASTVTIDGGAPASPEGASFEAPVVPAPAVTPVVKAPADAVKQVALGRYFACALRASGFVDCWGMVPEARSRWAIVLDPYRVGGIQDAVQIAAKGNIMCARSRSGAVSCLFGFEHAGTPGRPAAVPVDGLTDADDIAVGSGPNENHAVTVCARSRGAARTVKCWSGWYGQRGPKPVARVVRHLPPARELVLDDDVTLEMRQAQACILDDAGALYCWEMAPEKSPAEPGGDGLPFLPGKPYRVAGLPLFEHAAIRWKEGVGIRKGDRRAVTWHVKEAETGWPPYRQRSKIESSDIQLAPALDGADILIGSYCGVVKGKLVCDEPHPSNVSAVVPADRGGVALSPTNGCLVATDGRVLCWGSNDGGLLAAPTTIPLGGGPMTVVELNAAVDVAVTDELSCALRKDGTVWCWGSSMGPAVDEYEVRPRRTTPKRIAAGVKAISGGGTICVLFDPDRIECLERTRAVDHAFGDLLRVDGVRGVRTMSGTLGSLSFGLENGDVVHFQAHGRRPTLLPAHPNGLRSPAGKCAIERTAGGGTFAPGRVFCLEGENTNEPGHWVAKGIDDAGALAAGHDFTCALRAGGAVSCWGTVPGEKTTHADAPTDMPTLAEAVDLVATDEMVCVRRRSGEVSCLGFTFQSGSELPTSFEPSRFAPALRDVMRLALAPTHGCALRRDGLVACFGRNFQGELGDGSIDAAGAQSPVAIPLR